MQDRPDARELLATLGDFLEQELLPDLDGPLKYRTRVAANLARILERELRLGNGFLLRERDRLCRLLGVGSEDLVPGSLHDQVEDLNQQLVSELQQDALPAGFEAEAWNVLLAVTRDKLAIVRPGYDDHDAAGEAP
jgi:hypothetical protein